MGQNLLAQEKSPYLLQHQHNPVWWHPWGEDAFARAKAENKMVFLSVGYATCHWCHVMEGDSFEKDDVAAILNEHFIAIKVDREERPDVDAIYMAAVQVYSGRGGWPMSVAMTPDGKPFWAGTFLPRQQFKHLLTQLANIWQSEQRPKIFLQADEIYSQLQKMQDQRSKPANSDEAKLIRKFYDGAHQSFDEAYGGFGPAPKFPSAMTLMGLMRLSKQDYAGDAMKMVTHSLDAMAKGGLQDQIGGGFHRYSTDDRWFAPHFEKMLYDNALLAIAYCEAYSINQNEQYRHIATNTLNYLLRDMHDDNGGFYSAEDADSEKAEGKFYVWTHDELKHLLEEEEFKTLAQYYELTPEGNFEPEEHALALEEAAGLKAVHGANILHIAIDKPFPPLDHTILQTTFRKLLQHRSQRVRPLLDDKILADWNGLTIGAFSKAYQILREPKFLTAATACATFLTEKMFDGKTLSRRCRNNEIGIPGLLTDYAATIFGLIELFYATADERWLNQALTLQDLQNNFFYSEDRGIFYESDGKDATLLFRNNNIYDNAVPSGNSLAVLNLIKLSELSNKPQYRTQAQTVVQNTLAALEHYPPAFPMMMVALIYKNNGGFACLDGVCVPQ